MTVKEFLYDYKTFKEYPRSNYMIGVEFEVGGAYEDWGYMVYQKTGENTFRPFASGRNLEQALENAAEKIKPKDKA